MSQKVQRFLLLIFRMVSQFFRLLVEFILLTLCFLFFVVGVLSDLSLLIIGKFLEVLFLTILVSLLLTCILLHLLPHLSLLIVNSSFFLFSYILVLCHLVSNIIRCSEYFLLLLHFLHMQCQLYLLTSVVLDLFPEAVQTLF